MRLKIVIAAACLAVVGLSTASETRAAARKTTNIPAQGLGPALKALAKERDFQVVYVSEEVAGLRTGGASGELTPDEALTQLLSGTGLIYRYLDEKTVTILLSPAAPTATRPPSAMTENGRHEDLTLAQVGELPPSKGEGEGEDSRASVERPDERGSQDNKGISEILVKGSHILNTDIPRSRDDAQPYIVFDREALERSGAADLDDFLRKKLTMNAQGLPSAQGVQAPNIYFGNSSEINLRGLGSNQTLVLIDGRRVASASMNGTPRQGNINGIPLAAIERIEILPTTASGIYGGGATGGVVNVILRRDYAGAEAQVTYNVAQNSSPTQYRVDFSSGFDLESGKSNVLLSASYEDKSGLLYRDRNFVQRGRAAILANHPASLQGGLPPFGATANIASRNGSPLFGPGTPSVTSIPVGYAGGGGLAPLQVNAGQYNMDLTNSAQAGGGLRNLLPEVTDKYLMATLRRQFSSMVDVFLEGNFSQQRSSFRSNEKSMDVILGTAPNNPFGQAIFVSTVYPELDSAYTSRTDGYRAVGGVIVRLPHNWTAEADYNWGRYALRLGSPLTLLTNTAALAVAFGDVDVLRDTNAFPLDMTDYLSPPNIRPADRVVSKGATLRVAGSIFSLPAGEVKVSSLLEHRSDFFDELMSESWNENLASYQSNIFPSRSQAADSAYMEFTLPLAGGGLNVRGIRLLELQLAGRYDDYEVNGVTNLAVGPGVPIVRVTNRLQSFDPTIALRYKPVEALMVRASYGTGFLPPTVQQLIATTNSSPFPVTDPKRGDEEVVLPVGTFLTGGNPNLQPEESESWSAGIVFTPGFLEGLRLGVDYTQIDKTNNIGSPFEFPQELVDIEDLVPERIIRGAPSDGFPVGPIVGLNQTLFNIAKARVEAFDVALDYQAKPAAFGQINFYSLATVQTQYKTQITPVAEMVENLGVTVTNPLKFKANAGVTWRRNDWTLDWSARYFHSYLASTRPVLVLRQGNGGRVPSQVYHDFFSSYRFSNQPASSWLTDAEIQFGVQNVFGTLPPVDMGQDQIYYSTLADPRLRNFSLSLKKSF